MSEPQPRPGWEPPAAPPQWAPPTPQPQWAPPRYQAPVPQPQWVPKSVLPVQPTTYPRFWRAPGIPVWRPLLAVLVGAVFFVGVSLVVTVLGLIIEAVATGQEVMTLLEGLTTGQATPGIILANSVALALLVPAALLLSLIAGQPAGFLHSVAGRFRWGWCFVALGIAFVGMAAYTGLTILLDGGVGSLGLSVSSYSWWLFVGLMLVTPFQAAAEEYLLRGVLFRTVAAWLPTERAGLVVGALVSSFVFMLLHSASDPWLNLMYFAMGLAFAWLTTRTGGLEAAIAVHVANNMIGMALVPFQDINLLFDRAAGAGSPVVLIQLAAVLIVVAVIAAVGKRRRLQVRGPAAQ